MSCPEEFDPPDDTATSAERPLTVPANKKILVTGEFASREQAQSLWDAVNFCLDELSKDIDLVGLDGVTIATSYKQALVELDRGYVSGYRLTPSEVLATGVAMTPAVIRDGAIKSHIVIDAGVMLPLADPAHSDFDQAFQFLAHECAHVEITERFDKAFPGVLLQKPYSDIHDSFRSQVITACWDEYAACWIAAPFGRDSTAAYESIFLTALAETRKMADCAIEGYLTHGESERAAGEVYGAYGNLLKFSAYHLGNMAGLGLTIDVLPNTRNALQGHWFTPYFDELRERLSAIAERYGQWEDSESFEAVGDLADALAADGGLRLVHLDDGTVYIDFTIP